MILAVPFSAAVSQPPQTRASEASPFSADGAFFAVSVRDLDASIRWYTDKLGMRGATRFPVHDGITGAILVGDGLEIELIVHLRATRPQSDDSASKGFPLGIFKAGFRVRDFERALIALREHGVEIAVGPFPASRDQRANVIIRDESGNLIQIFGGYAT